MTQFQLKIGHRLVKPVVYSSLLTGTSLDPNSPTRTSSSSSDSTPTPTPPSALSALSNSPLILDSVPPSPPSHPSLHLSLPTLPLAPSTLPQRPHPPQSCLPAHPEPSQTLTLPPDPSGLNYAHPTSTLSPDFNTPTPISTGEISNSPSRPPLAHPLPHRPRSSLNSHHIKYQESSITLPKPSKSSFTSKSSEAQDSQRPALGLPQPPSQLSSASHFPAPIRIGFNDSLRPSIPPLPSTLTTSKTSTNLLTHTLSLPTRPTSTSSPFPDPSPLSSTSFLQSTSIQSRPLAHPLPTPPLSFISSSSNAYKHSLPPAPKHSTSPSPDSTLPYPPHLPFPSLPCASAHATRPEKPHHPFTSPTFSSTPSIPTLSQSNSFSKPPAPNLSRQIFIGNLPRSTNMTDLRKAFTSLAPIVSIEIRLPYAKIEFAVDGAAERAVDVYDQGWFSGSKIEIQLALEDEQIKRENTDKEEKRFVKRPRV